MTVTDLNRYIDHTLLKPEAGVHDVEAAVEEAALLGVYAVCLSPSALPVSIPEGLRLAAVVGFPSGKHHPSVKGAEAALAAAHGADELDMVIDVGAAVEGRFDAVRADIRAVRDAAPGVLLKVIIESAALTDDAIVAACEAAEASGADFVKTSTGFHPAGGASVRAVELMRRTVGDRLGVKASGGIRTRAAAEEMIAAGASRLGLSASRAILAG